jgi:hypothetical protein
VTAVPGTDPGAAVLANIRPLWPVLDLPAGRVDDPTPQKLVLFPLSGPEDCAAISQDIRQARPDLDVSEVTLNFSQLLVLAPLSIRGPAPG